MADTFDGATINKPRIATVRFPIAGSEVVLIDGKRDQDTESNVGQEWDITSFATSSSDIATWAGKVGTAGILSIGSSNMGTYRITALSVRPLVDDFSTVWAITMTFRRHTAG
jgi:hypothetical protein